MAFEREGDPLDASARSYASQIRSEIASLGLSEQVPLAADTADWDAIFAAEGNLLRRLEPADLRRRAALVYQRYADVAGAEKAAARAANALDTATCDPDLLRADLFAVHNETARLYTLGYQVERERGDLARFVIYIGGGALSMFVLFVSWAFLAQYMSQAWASTIVAVASVAVIALLWGYERRRMRKRNAAASASGAAAVALVLLALIVAPSMAAQTPPNEPRQQAATSTQEQNGDTKPSTTEKVKDVIFKMPMVPMVILTGILGACFSVLQRVQRSSAGDPLVALLNLRNARTHTFLSIISGAIASLVVFAIFTGDMISGSLFPDITGAAAKSGQMLPLFDFLTETGPASVADYGKLLVWAFIAGFAERFVPDILDRFVADAKK